MAGPDKQTTEVTDAFHWDLFYVCVCVHACVYTACVSLWLIGELFAPALGDCPGWV